ncbi:MAG: RNA polymerase subunit sigma-70 [Terriglobia bacterium]|nr:MAG: RNA polymerase subunit sigma-70 [Terriglobia bacterium]
MEGPASETTSLLHAWAGGDRNALDRLTPRVYDELHRIARNFMRHERPDRTIQATALVHEAFLRLVEVNNVDWEQRAHFFAVCAQVMRRILLKGARRRATSKRGGGWERVTLEGIAELDRRGARELIALDEALTRLSEADPRRSQVVELRYFGGLSVEETAAVLKVSPETVARDWRIARAWLLSELE